MDNTQQDDEQDNEQRNGTENDVPAKTINVNSVVSNNTY